MVIIDQLRISDDGSRMFINVHVNTASYFESIYIDSITITTADKVMEATSCTPTNEFIYKETLTGNSKNLDLLLDISSITAAYNNYNPTGGTVINASLPYGTINFANHDFSKDLFFVYIICKNVGTPNICFEELSCQAQELTTVGVTFDTKLLYQRAMGYVKQLADDCNVPDDFIDFILNFNAFKAAVETDHYCDAVKFYNQLFSTPNLQKTAKSNCGCHG